MNVILLENLTPDTIIIPVVDHELNQTALIHIIHIPPPVANMRIKTGKKNPMLTPVKKSCNTEDMTSAGNAANGR